MDQAVRGLARWAWACALVTTWSVGQAQEVPVVPVPAVGHEHRREQETAVIRAHHLSRLQTRLTVEPAVLREGCRYESEIATHPPHKKVVLTFDDGPEPGQTEHILAVLKKHDIQATFFLVGHKARQYPELVSQIQESGQHIVANHSWDHPNFHDLSVADQAAEVTKTDAVLAPLSSLKLFRYPYGNSSCETNALLRNMGYKIVGWHVDTCDWAFDHDGSVDDKEALSCGVLAPFRKDFVGHVLASARAHNGGIVLMHEIHPNTLKKLDDIVMRLKEEGFSFAPLTDEGFANSMR